MEGSTDILRCGEKNFLSTSTVRRMKEGPAECFVTASYTNTGAAERRNSNDFHRSVRAFSFQLSAFTDRSRDPVLCRAVDSH